MRLATDLRAWINASCELSDAIALALEHRRRGEADILIKVAAAVSVAGQIAALRALLDR